ncbi:translocase [Gluconobacter japonicus]|uniref:Tim44 domain-containing protein n=1 Tax=Gluconobacter japonicus TaxID=376620 RepID=A0A9Q2FM13_GLUJA|nr:Tim44/TimA family putative adaptor protein [Gluconobacter japonicus]KXV39846.1 translocase [Gluconobacter japonicus]MBF0869848.1 Tim44 domain-containing protein [Gluconobacter japonicus]
MSSDDIHLPSALIGHTGHDFPWDIVVLAVLAVALGFRLYRVLGRRIGMQGVRQARPPVFPGAAGQAQTRQTPPPLPEAAGQGQAEPAAQVDYDIPAPATRVGGILGQMTQLDGSFTPQGFLKDAETIFRQVVPAFAAGDRAALSGLMTPQTEEAFLVAINARAEAGQTQRSDLRGIDSMAILDAMLVAGNANTQTGRIEVRIVSRQVNMLTDRQGEPVQGTDAVTEFHDLWLFEREFGASGTQWRLAASCPA